MKDRLPPHSIDAEQGVVGCCILSPADCIPEAASKLRPEAFYNGHLRTIFNCLTSMQDERKPIDLITIKDTLTTAGHLEAVGGVASISALADTVPSAANVGYYVGIVEEKYRLRETLKACVEGQRDIYESTDDPETTIDRIEANILRVTEQRTVTDQKPIKQLVNQVINKIEESHASGGKATMGIPTGFQDFDKMTFGLHNGDMIVIAARPSLGKTSLAMNIAEHVALEQKLPVGVFSLEMTAEALTMRLLCSRAKVNIRNIRDGFLAERDFPRLTRASIAIANSPLFIDDSAGLSIMQLRAKARRLHQQHGIKLFVIDYLQLLNSTNRRAENRQQEIADISNGIKALAKELDAPVIVLSQLNREIEKTGGRPKLSYLRESGSIEQDADLVALLYKEKDEEPDQEQDAVSVNLYIAKQRNGRTGEIRLTFLKNFTRFESASRVEAKDIPHSEPRQEYQSHFQED